MPLNVKTELINKLNKPNINLQKERSEFIKLGWDILKHKCLYYELANNKNFDLFRISDLDFDKMEKKYIKLAKLLNLPATAADMVGFDNNSPSCTLVLGGLLIDEFRAHNKKITQNKYVARTKSKV